jgi:arylsulfatase A-like enzyme
MTVPGLSRLLKPAGGGNKPNVIIFFCDDLGWQDLGCCGSGSQAGDPRQLPAVTTPNLDQMAAEGIRFTDFCVSASVCSASRGALLTGGHDARIGGLGALQPDSPQDSSYGHNGLNPNEITLAELLKGQGYAAGCVGKWHLGHHLMFLPTRQGFDSYYGVPYSNDTYPGADSQPPSRHARGISASFSAAVLRLV